MIPKRGLTLLAALVMGASLAASPALAKCPKDCKKDIGADLRACKAPCKEEATRPEKKACKKACVDEKKRRLGKCKAAAAPIFPGCSPSGAFIDTALE